MIATFCYIIIWLAHKDAIWMVFVDGLLRGFGIAYLFLFIFEINDYVKWKKENASLYK